MVYLGYAPLSVDVSKGQRIDPDDLLDAIRTLTPQTKVCIPIPPPGQGPDHFLRWANEELAEAKAGTGDVSARKAFNCSILAKCAVECLIDWYLDKYLLNLTLPQYAGTVKKLDALKADERLGMGLSLFSSVMFEPRNDAVHDYEPVDLQLVEKSVQLANLTVKNCVHGEPPGMAPIFYGTVELYQGRASLEKNAERDPKTAVYLKNPDADGLYLSSIGPLGAVSVVIDRKGANTRVVLVTSDGDRGATDVRFCPIDRTFGTERLQKLFHTLEATGPAVINVTERNIHTVVESLTADRPPRKRNKPENGPTA